MPTPNPQAVEAEWPELWVTRSAFGDGSPKWYLSGGYNPTSQDVLPQRLYGPVTHIRSQLLTELAEELSAEFEKRAAKAQEQEEAMAPVDGALTARCGGEAEANQMAADFIGIHCRELAAKEESDG